MAYPKERMREYNRLYYLRNKEKELARNKKYIAKHREHILAKKKESHKKNAAIELPQKRAWYQANREAQIKAATKWMANNPERARANCLRAAHRRRKAEGSFSQHDLKFLFARQYGLCYYCCTPIHERYEIDHIIPLSKGGTNWRHNLALACKPCNRAKAAKTEGWQQHWFLFQH